jgi:hypothetical protein
MVSKDIIWSARLKLDDTVLKYLWEDPELLSYLNTSQNEWCRETGCLRDDVTPAICQIPLLSNKLTYPMDPRITEIHNGWLTSGWPRIDVKDEIWLDRNAYSWRTQGGDPRFILPDYSSGYLKVIRFPKSSLGYWTGAFIFTASSKTIAQTGTDFSTLLAIGSQVFISGTLHNGTTIVPETFTVVTIGTNSFTVAESIVDETVASGGIMQKVTDTLNLSVSRLPLVQLTLDLWETQSPEIKFDYHSSLVNGILREAYQKQDSQCLDKAKSEEHRGLFEKSKTKAYNEIQILRYGPTVLVPNRGRL